MYVCMYVCLNIDKIVTAQDLICMYACIYVCIACMFMHTWRHTHSSLDTYGMHVCKVILRMYMYIYVCLNIDKIVTAQNLMCMYVCIHVCIACMPKYSWNHTHSSLNIYGMHVCTFIPDICSWTPTWGMCAYTVGVPFEALYIARGTWVCIGLYMWVYVCRCAHAQSTSFC